MSFQLDDIKINIPTAETLDMLFEKAVRYTLIKYDDYVISGSMQITSYDGEPCIYVPIRIKTPEKNYKDISMLIFI